MTDRVASTIWGSVKALLLISLLYFGPMFLIVLRANLMRERVLCRTDHQALLAAGQEMLRKTAQGHQDSGDPQAHNSRRSGGSTRVPDVIRALGARSVFIESDGHLRIIMHGGMTHFGFDIYTEDFKEPFAGFPYGDHRILDKLWYFDDEYKWPDYDETVAAMLQRNRPGWGFVSLNIQVWGLITTVVMTLACRRRKWAIALGPTVMFVLNFMGQNILGRGSPAAYACAILFPMCGGFASCLTLTITRRLTRIKKG